MNQSPACEIYSPVTEEFHLHAMSKSQIDQLGIRLKGGDPTEADLRSLDEYRRSFGAAYETVINRVRDQLKLEPTGRPTKSTASVIEKLQRETIRFRGNRSQGHPNQTTEGLLACSRRIQS